MYNNAAYLGLWRGFWGKKGSSFAFGLHGRALLAFLCVASRRANKCGTSSCFLQTLGVHFHGAGIPGALPHQLNGTEMLSMRSLG